MMKFEVGKVYQHCTSNDMIHVLGSLHTTYHGAALVGENTNVFNAVCSKKSTIIILPVKELLLIFEKNFETGHIIMKKTAKLFRTRIEKYTKYIVSSFASHPSIKQ